MLLSVSVSISEINVPLATPAGHDAMFAEQPGGGEVHPKTAPAGVDVSIMAVLVPEQMVVENGPFTNGNPMMVTCFEAGGSPVQPASV